MHHRFAFASGLALALLLATAAFAVADRGENRAYLTSGPGPLAGVFYARCTPAGRSGNEGRTEIFRVGEAGDTKLDAYDGYPPGGVCLGWSPEKGKVAVLAVMLDGGLGSGSTREEIRFLLGGEKLASYTADELIAMGARETIDSAHGSHAGYRILGCEQIPGTNEYDFVLTLDDGKTLRFDITTGRLRDRATTQPSGR